MTHHFRPLGDLAEFINGVAFRPEDWGDEGLKIIRIQNLTDASKPYNFTKREVDSKYIVDRGDILVSWSASLGVFVWDDEKPALVNQHIFRVLPRDWVVDKQYLRHLLVRALADMVRHLHGATMQHVNRGEFLSTPVFLPPLNEQRRIAAILDKADALRQKRRAALQKLDSLTQSLFLDMFGDPIDGCEATPKVPVSSFVSHFETGKSIAPNEDENATGVVRVLKVSAVTSGDYRPDESKPVPGGYVAPCSHIVKPGDLLFSRANTAALIGATAYVPNAAEKRLLPDKIWRFIWRDAATIDPIFVWFMFRQLGVRRELAQLSSGTSGSMKNISQDKVLGMRVRLPPHSEQKAFARAVSKSLKQREWMHRSQAALDSGFSTLQHRAFRGEL